MSTVDQQLLAAYVKERSESAFREIVERYGQFVYSSAFRRLRDHHLAEDVTQATFVILAEKAGKLRKNTMLGGWLWTTAAYVAQNLLRRRAAQKRREQQAVPEETESDEESIWQQLRPELDRALDMLAAHTRQAVLSYYILGRSQRQVAAELGTSEDGARKRIGRGIEKLRKLLAARGVAVPLGMFIALFKTRTAEAASPELLESVHQLSYAAGTGAAAAGGTVAALAGSAARAMRLARLKVAAAYTCVAVAVGGAGTAVAIHALRDASAPAAGGGVFVDHAQLAAQRPDYVGIWGIWGAEEMRAEDRPWLKGTLVAQPWAQIEPEKDHFDFGRLDFRLKRAVGNGHRHLMLAVYAGTKSPQWLYRHGVPKVTTDAADRAGRTFPYYLSPRYKSYLKRMIYRLADHIKSYPPELRNRIIAVQCPVGKSGAADAYDGEPLDKKYRISNAQWDAYQKEMFAVYCSAFKYSDPPIVPLFNVQGLRVHAWLKKRYPRTWRKYSFPGHGYQQHQVFNGQEKILIPDATRYQNGWAMLVRDECSSYGADCFREAPVWNTYWTLLHALHWGVDFLHMRKQHLEQCEPWAVGTFEWFNTYAGTHDPAESPGAWVALRDGLDARDTKRFPESKYGPLAFVKGGDWTGADGAANPQRYLNIAQAFAAYGAQQGDNSMPAGMTPSLHFKKMNDVAWKSMPGNFGMYLYQHDPRGTSQGWWRVGSKAQPYGRFARGFNHAKGWDAMYFDLDDGFFNTRPAGGHTINLRVVYFDQGTGQWALKYDAVDDPQKIACTVTKTGTGRWREKTLTLTDANLGNRCPYNTDFMLLSVDGKDDLFHMIEVTRGVPGRKHARRASGDGIRDRSRSGPRAASVTINRSTS